MLINFSPFSGWANSHLKRSQAVLGSSVERLSSGLRINSARDDAAGLAIANRMTSRIKGNAAAMRTVSDAIGLLQTVEGGASDINSLLQRMRELTVQHRNGSLSFQDREFIQTEIAQIRDEINRIGAELNFAGRGLLDAEQSLRFQLSSEASDTLELNLQPLNTDTLGVNAIRPPVGPPLSEITIASGANAGTWKLELEGIINRDGVLLKPGEAEAAYHVTPGSITIHQVRNRDGSARPGEYAVKVGDDYYHRAEGALVFDHASGVATYRVHNGYQQADIEDPARGVTLDDQPIDNVKLGWDKDGNYVKYLEWQGHFVEYDPLAGRLNNKFYLSGPNANTIELMQPDSLAQIDAAIAQVDGYRTYLGATQNRLESVLEGLSTSQLALNSARSRIEDADYAVETSNMIRSQIVQQAVQAVLAQANQIPQTVLSLLRG
ncbi:flagellin [Bordetella genomosp. 7]|uniref:Flagellin n=1 Tax=Bordetella genomosp. 7 TaxID=1416805 RepID=A0A261RCS7_9BORD|nr:flagellin [Bordetella genomosp. 7]OZI22440.1 hypothetical protein CAL19_07830 [Bordetella genomosp. 7]